jgi:hypothetical protein
MILDLIPLYGPVAIMVIIVAGAAARAWFRRIRTRMIIWRGMKDFNRELREMLDPHGTGHTPTDNNRDSA